MCRKKNTHWEKLSRLVQVVKIQFIKNFPVIIICYYENN